MSAQAADAFGVRHAEDCQHTERVWKRVDGRWQCSGCGQCSAATSTETTP